jgi:hypothetical protein
VRLLETTVLLPLEPDESTVIRIIFLFYGFAVGVARGVAWRLALLAKGKKQVPPLRCGMTNKNKDGRRFPPQRAKAFVRAPALRTYYGVQRPNNRTDSGDDAA